MSNEKKPIRVIDAASLESRVSLPELWARRSLIWVFARRDFAVRFKQTYAGFAWLVLKPTLWLLALTVVFGFIAKAAPVSSAPYAVIVLAGLAPWAFFAAALNEMTGSLMNSRHIVSKIYFPRLTVPLAAVLPPLADMIVAFGLMAALFVWYGFMPSWRVVLLPALLLLMLALVSGLGLWLCALNTRFRDVQMILPFLLQVGMYVSPVGYPADQVPDTWQWLYNLNPMVGVIEGIRWSLIPDYAGYHSKALISSAAMAVALNVTGYRYFGKVEKQLADVL